MHFDYAQCKQKGSATLLLLLAGLVLIPVVIYYLSLQSPKSIPTVSVNREAQDSIKTYTNQQLGFEFKYQKDLTVKEDSEEQFNKRGNGNFRKNFKGYVGYEPGKLVGAVVVLDKDNNFDKNPFTVWVFDNQDEVSIDKWYSQYWFYPFVWGDFTYTGKFTLAPKEEATISGQMAKSGIVDYQPGKPKFVYLSKDKKIYLFRIIGKEGDQILSTFKFTNYILRYVPE